MSSFTECTTLIPEKVQTTSKNNEKKRTRLADEAALELSTKKQKLLSANIRKSLNVLTATAGKDIAKSSAALFSANASTIGNCTRTSNFDQD